MGKFTSFVKLFDIYGNAFQLRINNQKKFQTAIGGFFSLMTIIILVICILNFGADFFDRTSPKVVIEEGLFTNDTSTLNGTEYVNRSFILGIDRDYINYNKLIIRDSQGLNFADECSADILNEYELSNTDMAFFCINLNDFIIGKIFINFKSCSESPSSIISQFLANNGTCDTNTNVTMKNVRMMDLNLMKNIVFIAKMSYYPLVFNTIF
jgi:hypothetical protein